MKETKLFSVQNLCNGMALNHEHVQPHTQKKNTYDEPLFMYKITTTATDFSAQRIFKQKNTHKFVFSYSRLTDTIDFVCTIQIIIKK